MIENDAYFITDNNEMLGLVGLGDGFGSSPQRPEIDDETVMVLAVAPMSDISAAESPEDFDTSKVIPVALSRGNFHQIAHKAIEMGWAKGGPTT